MSCLLIFDSFTLAIYLMQNDSHNYMISIIPNSYLINY